MDYREGASIGSHRTHIKHQEALSHKPSASADMASNVLPNTKQQAPRGLNGDNDVDFSLWLLPPYDIVDESATNEAVNTTINEVASSVISEVYNSTISEDSQPSVHQETESPDLSSNSPTTSITSSGQFQELEAAANVMGFELSWSQQRLEFAHNTARNFISSLVTDPAIDPIALVEDTDFDAFFGEPDIIRERQNVSLQGYKLFHPHSLVNPAHE